VFMKRSYCREDKVVVFILLFCAESNLNREDSHRYGSCQCMNQCHALFKEGKRQSQNSLKIYRAGAQRNLFASEFMFDSDKN
jgi:hypothetical protein